MSNRSWWWLGAATALLVGEASAQEGPVEPVPNGLVATLVHPAGRAVGALIVMALVQTLKEWRDRQAMPEPTAPWWRRWLYGALVAPVGRLFFALAFSLPAGATAWASGAPFDQALELVVTTWVGAMVANTIHGVVAKSMGKPSRTASPKGPSSVAIIWMVLALAGCETSDSIASLMVAAGVIATLVLGDRLAVWHDRRVARQARVIDERNMEPLQNALRNEAPGETRGQGARVRRAGQILCVVVAIGSVGACAQFSRFLRAFSSMTGEAATSLQLTEMVADAIAAALPPATNEQIRRALVRARQALAAADRLAAGASDMTRGDANAAFAEFRLAYDELVGLLGPLVAGDPSVPRAARYPLELPARPLAADPIADE